MNRKLCAVIICLVCMCLPALYAQTGNGSISGLVRDADKKPFNLATVLLTRAGDTAAVKTIFTDAAGKFTFINLPEAAYRITVTASGYTPWQAGPFTISQQNLSLATDTINMQPVAVTQEGVVVTGKKPFIEQKIDRVIVNVDAMIANAGTTALDVLAKSPGVLVDQSGNISLKGKGGVMILIDNKPTYLGGEDLQNYLSSIPSSQLGTIEIMVNPPARYDASGNAGVINIKLKRIKTKGFNGNLSVNAAKGQLMATNNSLTLNYRYNKINVFANLGYGIGNNFQDLEINRRFLQTDGSTRSFFNQHNNTRFTNQKFNIKTGVDYYVSDRTVIGTVFTGLFFTGVDKDNNFSYLLNPDYTPYTVVQAVNRKDKNINNKGANFNLRHQLKDKKQEITFDADYINYDNSMNQRFINIVNAAGNPEAKEFLDGNLPSNLDIYVGSINYTNAIKGGWNFEWGVKSSLIKTGNLANYYNVVGGIPSPDYDKSNDFRYRENINAAYVNVNTEFGAFAIQTGLRLENTISRGRQLGNAVKPDSSFSFEYTSLFPTVYLGWTVDTLGKHYIGLNYGRRVDRPFYQDLNPFILPFDKYTFYVGNPYLRPAFTNSVQLSYTYNNKLTTTFSYAKAKNEVFETIEIVDTLYYSRPGNIGNKEIKSLSVTGAFTFFKKLTLNFYGELTHLKAQTRLSTGTLDASGFYGYISPTLQLALDKGWAAELSFVYLSDVLNAQLKSHSYWQMNGGVQKTVSQNLTVKLNATDIFYSFVNRGIINNLDKTEANYKGLLDTRRVGLTLSYRFGKAIANLKRHNTTAADAEKKRVKT